MESHCIGVDRGRDFLGLRQSNLQPGGSGCITSLSGVKKFWLDDVIVVIVNVYRMGEEIQLPMLERALSSCAMPYRCLKWVLSGLIVSLVGLRA